MKSGVIHRRCIVARLADHCMRDYVPVTIAVAAGLMLALAFAPAAGAQGLFAEPEQVIYGGNPAAQAGISLMNWGGGVCKESTRNTLAGSRSIEITPKGLYQGGVIEFATAQDLTKWFDDHDAYLQFVTRLYDVQESYDPWAVGVAAPGATDIYGQAKRTGRPVRRVQVMLFFEGGRSTECQVEVNAFKLAEGGWMNVSFPFAALREHLELPAYRLTRIVISGDGTETFHVGEIRIVRDTAPLEANADEDKESARYYSILFRGTAQTGASAVRYTWDFDKRNGIQEEAVGDIVYHRYPNAGDYVATLTVSDVFGLKKPSVSTVNVTINE